MKFSYTTNSGEDAAITAAREAYNANAETPFETNAQYLTFVLQTAIASWGEQHLSEVGRLQKQLRDSNAEITRLSGELAKPVKETA